MHFRVGNGEFGEIYHVACACCLDESVTVTFDNCQIGKDFFDTVGLNGRIQQCEEGGPSHLGESAKVIRDHYCNDRIRPVGEAIHDKAQTERWSYPPAIRELLTNDPKLLLWHRTRAYQSHRNSSVALIEQLIELSRDHHTIPVIIGDSTIRNSGCIELVRYWDDAFFNTDSIAKQLWCLEALFQHGNALASLGPMSGAMDGPAMFFGRRTVFLARHSDATPRMRQVCAGVPNLMWQQVEYSSALSTLSAMDLSAVERRIWC